jgi:hypothetical protein
MKALNSMLALMLLPLAAALFVAAPVVADCDNYGNEVNVGSDYDCTVNKNYCDGESGPAGSGAGAGAGAGAGGQSGASAGASAGSSTDCGTQCAGSNCTTNAGNANPSGSARNVGGLVKVPQDDLLDGEGLDGLGDGLDGLNPGSPPKPHLLSDGRTLSVEAPHKLTSTVTN